MIREIIFITLVLTVVIKGTISNDKIDKGRIVGGYPIEIKQRPFQVALYADGSFCGGSIIGPYKVLTAGHCVRGKSAAKSLVYVGSKSRSTGGTIYYINRISIHPGYNPSASLDNDVAVLTVTTPFRYSASVYPIGLLSARPAAGTDAVVSGWGSTRSGGTVESYLREVHVPIVDQAVCRRQYGTSTITNKMVCAGVSTGGKDSCQGNDLHIACLNFYVLNFKN